MVNVQFVIIHVMLVILQQIMIAFLVLMVIIQLVKNANNVPQVVNGVEIQLMNYKENMFVQNVMMDTLWKLMVLHVLHVFLHVLHVINRLLIVLHVDMELIKEQDLLLVNVILIQMMLNIVVMYVKGCVFIVLNQLNVLSVQILMQLIKTH